MTEETEPIKKVETGRAMYFMGMEGGELVSAEEVEAIKKELGL